MCPCHPARRERRLPSDRAQRGAISVLVVLVLFLVVTALAVLATSARVVLDRARAQGAADAAALAAAAADDAAMRVVLQHNGAVLRSMHRNDGDVVVEVQVGVARAQARARVSSGP